MISAEPVIVSLREAIEVARRGDDPEGVHQARVASRRLDAWLRLGGHRVLRDDLRWLRRGLARARDLDVVREMAAARHLAPWFEAARQGEQARVSAALADERVAALLDALAALPPTPPLPAARRIPGILRKVLRRGAAVADVSGLHALRRSIRTLRFALEWLDAPSGAIVGLQDAFGDLSDKAALLRFVAERNDPDEVAWREQLAVDLEAIRCRVVETWRQTQPLLEEEAAWTSM